MSVRIPQKNFLWNYSQKLLPQKGHYSLPRDRSTVVFSMRFSGTIHCDGDIVPFMETSLLVLPIYQELYAGIADNVSVTPQRIAKDAELKRHDNGSKTDDDALYASLS